MKTRCMVVDDEPLARKVIKNHISKLPSLELVKECKNAMEAAAYLHGRGADLIFLDIKMPEMSGMDFLKTLDGSIQVILTTAYAEYALDSYEYGVLDYLLKPISFERFLKAVNKAIKPGTPPQPSENDYIFLRVNRAERRIGIGEILCVEAWRNSVKVYLEKETLMVNRTITAMETCLPKHSFIRIHKSFMVAINKIDRIEKNKVFLGEMTAPVGKYYKKDVEEMMASLRFKGKDR